MKIDIGLIEELADLGSENWLNNTVEKKGLMVNGEFTLYLPMYEFTKAKFLQDIEVKTPVLLNFFRTTQIKSNADSLRDMRCVCLKFYTKDGEWDLICSSIPSFFIDKVEKLPLLIKALKPSLENEISNYAQFWDFISDNPETMHMLLWLFSDRGTIKSYRHLEFFSVNTYSFTNENGERFFVRCKFSPVSGVRTITRQESEFLAGFDPNVACRDFHNRLEDGEFVTYDMFAQIIGEEEKEHYDFDLLDISKLWPEKLIPTMKIGKLVVKDINNCERALKTKFNPKNLVEGVDFSQTEMLHILGLIMTGMNGKNHETREFEKKWESKIKEQLDYCDEKDAQAYRQAGEFYDSLSELEKNHLIENLLDSIMFVDETIQERLVKHLLKTHKELGSIIEKGLDF